MCSLFVTWAPHPPSVPAIGPATSPTASPCRVAMWPIAPAASTATSRLELVGVGERGHRPAGVDDEQHGVAAGRDVALDQRPPGAGRRLPVDVLDVVAEHVLAEVVEVHAAAAVDRAVLAVEHVLGPPPGGMARRALTLTSSDSRGTLRPSPADVPATLGRCDDVGGGDRQ